MYQALKQGKNDVYDQIFPRPRSFKDKIWAYVFIFNSLTSLSIILYYYLQMREPVHFNIDQYIDLFFEIDAFKGIGIALLVFFVHLIYLYTFPTFHVNFGYMMAMYIATSALCRMFIHKNFRKLYLVIIIYSVAAFLFWKMRPSQKIISKLIRPSAKLIMKNFLVYIILFIITLMMIYFFILHGYVYINNMTLYMYTFASLIWMILTFHNIISMIMYGIVCTWYFLNDENEKPKFSVVWFFFKHAFSTSFGTAASPVAIFKKWTFWGGEFDYVACILYNLSYNEANRKMKQTRMLPRNVWRIVFNISFFYNATLLTFFANYLSQQLIIEEATFVGDFLCLLGNLVLMILFNNSIQAMKFCIKTAPDRVSLIHPDIESIINPENANVAIVLRPGNDWQN